MTDTQEDMYPTIRTLKEIENELYKLSKECSDKYFSRMIFNQMCNISDLILDIELSYDL